MEAIFEGVLRVELVQQRRLVLQRERERGKKRRKKNKNNGKKKRKQRGKRVHTRNRQTHTHTRASHGLSSLSSVSFFKTCFLCMAAQAQVVACRASLLLVQPTTNQTSQRQQKQNITRWQCRRRLSLSPTAPVVSSSIIPTAHFVFKVNRRPPHHHLYLRV